MIQPFFGEDDDDDSVLEYGPHYYYYYFDVSGSVSTTTALHTTVSEQVLALLKAIVFPRTDGPGGVLVENCV